MGQLYQRGRVWWVKFYLNGRPIRESTGIASDGDTPPQEARRILDRIYGYKVSEVLWRKVPPARSAGRVQSVATRIVVEREWERMRFVSAGYWDLSATFLSDETAQEGRRPFEARLVTVDGARVATGRDFASDGSLTPPSGIGRASCRERVYVLV